jgi:hypothetical protein
MILLRKLKELGPEDVDADPLVVLPCGHALLVSSLDAHMRLEECYARGADEEWRAPLVLGSESGARQPGYSCPMCRCARAGLPCGAVADHPC